jgi:hypothetical protein
MDQTSALAQDIVRRQGTLETERQPWVRNWEDVSELVLPRYVNTFRSGGLNAKTPGQLNQEKQFDPSPTLALNKFAAAMDSMLTPRLQKWHRLKATDNALNKSIRVQRYFDEVRDILFHFRYAPKANFASQMFEHWMATGAFGTACLFIDRLDGGGLRYKALPLGEIFFTENHQGMVGTVYRKFRLTALQAAQKFGLKCPEPIQEAAKDQKKQDHKYTFIHCVRPRADLDPFRRDHKGMEYASYYVSCEPLALVDEGGFSTFPYALSRYVTGPGEKYGRSPALDVLSSIKTLNEQKKTILKMGHRAVDPIILAHDDGVIGNVSLRPGAVNYGGVDAQGRKLVHTLDMASSIPIGKDLMDDERDMIKDAFWVTLFQILVETPQMTATEVLERVKEKGVLLAPMMGRQQSECLGPLIERELDILQRDGLLPPMPPELEEAGGDFNVIYESPLSKAMQAEEASGFMRTLETAINISQATQDPSALDWLDVDTAMPEIADIQSTPARWIRTFEEVMAIRENRQQAAAQQQMAEAAPAIASILKTTGSAV